MIAAGTGSSFDWCAIDVFLHLISVYYSTLRFNLDSIILLWYVS